MKFLKQSTACTILFGVFVDKTDGVTLKTDSTTITDIDHASTGIFLSKNGGTAAVRHATVTASTAEAYGKMKVTLDTTDTNTCGRLDILYAKAATYLPVEDHYMVLPANVYDALMGTDLLDISLTQVNGTAQTATLDTIKTQLADVHDTDLPALKTVVDDIHNTDLPAVKTMTDKIGTVTNTGGTATLGAILGDFANSALVTRVADLHTDVADVHTDVADVHTDVGTAITNIGDVHATDLPAVMTMLTDIHNTDLPAVKTVVDDIHNTDLPAVKAIADKIPLSDGTLKLNTTCSSDIKSGLSTQAELNKVPKSDGTTSWNATALAAILTQAASALTSYDPPTKGEMDSMAALLATAAELAKVPKSDSNVSWNATALAAIQSEATGALNAYDPPTKAELDTAQSAVRLANAAHGGAAATLQLKSIAVSNSDAGQPALKLESTGAGNSHAIQLTSTNGCALNAVAGSHALSINSSAGNGLVIVGATGDIVADITGTLAVCTQNTDMLEASAVKTAMEASGSYLEIVKAILKHKMEIDDSTGDVTLYNAGGGSTKYQVAGGVTDNSTTTTRKELV